MLIKKRRSSCGFTVAELLITLVISALLLAAVAVAFNASFMNYTENEKIIKTLNSARQALFRMTTQLRTATIVNPNEPDYQCSMFTADNNDITYKYNSSDNKLYLITNDDLMDDDYVLCDNVTAMTFTRETYAVNYEVKNIQITMTVERDGTQQTLSAAVVIRQNLQYLEAE